MLDFLDELFLFLNQTPKREPFKLSSFVVGLILFISLILLVFELNWIFNLLSPLKFILTFSLAGLIMGLFLYFILVRIEAVNSTRRSFLTLLTSGILLSLSLSSKINRADLPDKANEDVLVVDQPEIGKSISRIPISIDGKIFELRAQIEKGNQYKKGDKIHIIRHTGMLGFVLIAEEFDPQLI